MKKIKEILLDIQSDIDLTSTNLIDEGYLDSLNIIRLVAQIETDCSISILAEDIIAENFIDFDSICRLVEKYKS